MADKKKLCYSGIGGQAVLEGIMMKNKNRYSIAVRKPDGEIAVDMNTYEGLQHGNKIKELPFIRGIFNFIDSMVLGMRCLNVSASFYEEDEEETSFDRTLNKISRGKAEAVISGFVTTVAILLALGLFIVLPYFLSSLLKGYILNASLLAIMEGLIRIVIFVLYVWGISAMSDIKRLYMYHGAEHKCINCLERGRELNVKNVKRSSRLHKRCGTSFMFFVMFVSILLFFFIRVENPVYKVLLRIALMPVVAGISYEIIRLAGRSNHILVRILSAPGMLIQRMTTKEPDESMIEVAIAAVEAVYDWKAFLNENFDYAYEIEETAEEDVVEAAGTAEVFADVEDGTAEAFVDVEDGTVEAFVDVEAGCNVQAEDDFEEVEWALAEDDSEEVGEKTVPMKETSEG